MSEKIERLRFYIRECLKKELEALAETSTTAGAPGFQTPNAFAVTKDTPAASLPIVKKKLKCDEDTDGNEMDAMAGLSEARSNYELYRQDETSTPVQKIGRAIKEINSRLNEIDQIVAMNERLKKESNTGSHNLWKRTHKHLSRIESKLLRTSQRIKELKA
jgi:hypothetical protein